MAFLQQLFFPFPKPLLPLRILSQDFCHHFWWVLIGICREKSLWVLWTLLISETFRVLCCHWPILSLYQFVNISRWMLTGVQLPQVNKFLYSVSLKALFLLRFWFSWHFVNFNSLMDPGKVIADCSTFFFFNCKGGNDILSSSFPALCTQVETRNLVLIFNF